MADIETLMLDRHTDRVIASPALTITRDGGL
jgi:hypothetical protein